MDGISPPACRYRFPLAIAAVAILIAAGCQRFEPAAPEPTAPPMDAPVAATPVPIATEPPMPDSTPSAGSEIIEGRSYIRQPLQGATLWYEEKLGRETVLQLEAAYAVSRQLLSLELGVESAFPLNIYLSSALETVRFAESHDFQHPAWLGGFYYFLERDGEIEGAEVFVNAAATSIPQTIGHELTHLMTPSAPIWLGEGIAEYMGSGVSMLLEPQWQQRRMLQARRTVRAAVLDDTLPGFEALTRFEWNAVDEYALLELIYSETWLILEFISRTHGTDTLPRFLVLYDQGLSHTEDPFPQLLGMSAADLWTAFGTDIVKRLTEPERVGVALCSIGELGEQSLVLTDEWNGFAPLIIFQDQEVVQERLRSLTGRWQLLRDNIKTMEPSGDAVAVHGLFVDYFEIMIHALRYFQRGDTLSANAAMSLANDMVLRSATVLNSAFAERPWLAC